ncbi:hypothetical protein DFJ58DRAFT_630881, partial [Suillus subalutaceus]|uniref:uncharacterized protein n=1 Tax=Suillus subalutaceus TaxID=48586 RepID=UPI001B87B09E
MSPDMSTMESTSSLLYNIPKLAEDGSNWITYKERAQTVIRAWGLVRYMDGRAIEPALFKKDTNGDLVKDDGTKPSQTEIEDLEKKQDEFYQKDSLVKQYIFSTISDQMLLQVQNTGGASKVWTEICTIHEG